MKTSHLVSTLLITLIISAVTASMNAQSVNVSNAIPSKQRNIPKYNLLSPTPTLRSDEEIPGVSYFELDKKLTRQLLNDAPKKMTFVLPLESGKALEMDMETIELFSSNCKSSNANDDELPFTPGVFYRFSSHDTTALLSVFEDQVIGRFYLGKNNLSLAEVNSTLRTEAKYALYPVTEGGERPFGCGTIDPVVDEDELRRMEQNISAAELRGTGPIVDIYFVVNHDIYLDVQNNNNTGHSINTHIYRWISGVFFMVKTLYDKKIGLDFRISGIKIWDRPAPFYRTDGNSCLIEFAKYMPNFNGDFAQLLIKDPLKVVYENGERREAGGLANRGTICDNARHSWAAVYSIANKSVSRPYLFPDDSWGPLVIAHELGHNLSAPHTQWCGWPGGPLDNCVATERDDQGRTCQPGPSRPPGGGHFMSYCSSIDFNLTDPRYDIIRQRIVGSWTKPCANRYNSSSPQILVSNPTAGSVYKSGGSITIKWTCNTVEEVQILLRKGSGGTWILSKQDYGFETNERTFDLLKTLPSGNDYSIRVGIVGSNLEMTAVYGESARFTIEALPDLVIASGDLTVTGTPSSPTMSLDNIIIHNQGNANAVATRVNIYLSRDAQIGSGDQLLTSLDIEALAAGKMTTKGFTMSPNVALIPNGTFYVGLIVDRADLVKESDEQNNSFYWASPQLTVNKGNSTSTLDVSPTVLNFISDGETQTLSFTSNTSWSISESLSWLSVSPVSGNNNGTPSVSCQANLSTAARTGTIAIIGAGKVITVTVNQAGTTTIAPDLTCTGGDLQINQSGSNYSLRISNLRISNQGNAIAPSSRAGIYLSSDQNFSTSDQLVGSLDIQALTSGGFVLRRVDVTFNTLNLSAGQYYIGVLVDNVQAITERNENNNVYYWKSPIVEVEGPPAPADCTCDIPLDAQSILCEDFQTFREGAISAQSSSNWRLWDPQSGDGIVTLNTNGDKSLLIHTANNVDADVLLLLGNRQQGTYELTWNMYIPSGSGAYFNMQYDQNQITYAFVVYFEDGNVSLTSNGSTYPSSASYASNTWTPIKLIIDTENRTAQLYTNNQLGASIPYNYSQIGAIDFYALQRINTKYWVDDICYYKAASSSPSGQADLTINTGELKLVDGNNSVEIQINNLNISNQGKEASTATRAIVYASSNRNISSSDYALGEIAIEALAVGSTTTKQISYRVTDQLVPGEYYIGVILDPDNVVVEEQEDNNIYSWSNPKLQIVDPNACLTPSNFQLKNVTSTTFTLFWDIGPSVRNSILQLSTDLGENWLTYDQYADGSPIRDGVAFYDYQSGQRAFLRVKAICETGESDWSAIVDVTLPSNALNDEACNAQSLDGGDNFTLGNLNLSSISATPFSCGPTNADVWFKITASASSMVIGFQKASQNLGADFVAAAYTGTCNALQLVTCNDDGGSDWYPKLNLTNLTIGRTYYIRVWDARGVGKSFWIDAYPSYESNSTTNAVSPQGVQRSVEKYLVASPKMVLPSQKLPEHPGESLSIVPNPNNGNFVVNYQSPLGKGQTTLTVRDFMGRICYQQKQEVASKSNSYNLSLAHLQQGIYTINVIGSGGKMLTSKVIIAQ